MHMRFLVTCAAALALTHAPASAQQLSNCPFNVSDASPSGLADTMRDGMVLTRYARGMRGANLVAGTTLSSATVEANIAANIARLDVNGNGVFDQDDAAAVTRLGFGFSSDKWFVPRVDGSSDGAAGSGALLASDFALRNTPATVSAFMNSGCPLPFSYTAATAEQKEASRFLIRSTFGPSRNEIVSFLALPLDNSLPGGTPDIKRRASTWINNQFALARSQTHFQYVMQRKVAYDAINAEFGSEMAREAFWKQALKSNDQLRQRVAFALSQILVVSSNGASDPYGLVSYLDLLADNAFGNYRDILRKVALSPQMGIYLSHLRNDGLSTTPNENFAREILQLFSVGLFRLNADGTKQLDGNSQPIATYTEDTVKGFAKVFTGFTYDDPYCKPNDPGWSIDRSGLSPPCADGYGGVHPLWEWAPGRDDLGPNFPPVLDAWKRAMVPFPGRHNALEKQLLIYNDYPGSVASCAAAIARASAATNPGLLPAINVSGSTLPRTKVSPAQAMQTIDGATPNDGAIDNIFCHPNVAPFVARHFIKFFVTSNPSAAYVQRVADKFNNNGSNVRGDMKAVIRAVLLDDEAILAQTVLTATDYKKFGKLREPMLRLSAIWRGFNATSQSGFYKIHRELHEVDDGLSQAPLESPTVFNYYHPEYAPPGPVAQAGAIGPEFEITTTTAIAATQNYFGNVVANTASNRLYRQFGFDNWGDCNTSSNITADCIFSDLSDLYAIHGNTSQLFDYINLVLMGGTLSAFHIDDVNNPNSLVKALDTAFPNTLTLSGTPTARQISDWQDRRRDRVKGALWLAVHTPDFQIQR